MKRRGRISPFICLLIMTAALTAASVACAQDFMAPPFVPLPPGTMPTLMAGRFYIQAGVRYRSVESLRLNAFGGAETLTAASGTPPFGPTTPGNFGVGTGKTGFIGNLCPGGTTWLYDNGQISSAVNPDGNPAIPVACADPNPVPPPAQITTVCNLGLDSCWTDSVITPELGRDVVSVDVPTNCCAGRRAPVSTGSFVINDPTTQVNNLASIAGTTQVTFQVGFDGSQLFLINTTPDANQEIGPKTWSPTIAMGYQVGDFFDVFSGFSWFSVNSSMGFSTVITGQQARNIVQDTFPFISDDASAWPPGGGAAFDFHSSNTIIGGNALHTYKISPNRPANGISPNRQFLTQAVNAPGGLPLLENIRQTVNNTVDINVYEMRWGGRSWLPLYGMGSLGAYTGLAFMPAYYKITENRNYVSLGPNVPGWVFASESTRHEDWRPHYGVFVGADLALGVGPVYVNASIDYAWATLQSYRLDFVETNFNPGGMTAGLSGGFRF